MTQTLDPLLILVALAPFIAALFTPLLQRLIGSYAGWVLALVPAGIFAYLSSYLHPIATGTLVQGAIDWVPVYNLKLSFYLDGLSLTFALTIAGIGALVVLYAASYLKGHPHQGRFLAFLMAFMGAMLGLVLADNMLALFMFWELTSVTSFLLIGFDHGRQAARRGAIQALVVTNIGGMGLLAGVLLLQMIAGTWEMSAIGGVVRDSGLYGVVLACILLAAFTKSAQFPFHFWLPNAMEAPTPVSAFLHSATMVQAGVYLLARTTPFLGGTEIWTTLLVGFGGVTLIWGALGAMRQSDLKQMLAQTTIASLGLLVLLIGLGTETAILAMVAYFVAHALYKAAMFMIVGAVDHGTGTREITALGGLANVMPLTFFAAVLAGLAMVGLPPTIGFFAKEEMYLALAKTESQSILTLLVLVAGNALLGGVALLVVIKPFLGTMTETPRHAHEAPPAMLAGPILLAIAGVIGSIFIIGLADYILSPAASSIRGEYVESHLGWAIDLTSPVIWLSVATWILSGAVYYWAGSIRSGLRRASSALGWTADTVFDAVMFGLIRFAGAVTRWLHHGRLELYLVLVFVTLALSLFVPLLGMGGLERLLPTAELGNWSAVLAWPDLRPYEWGVIALAVIGLGAVLMAPSRLVAILSLGVQGAAVALIFLLFGAPDLAFTQFMVEILSVVILTLVMTKLKLDERDPRHLEDLLRDGTLAVVCGAGVSLLLMVVLSGPLDTRLSDFFTATSVPIAHGANIVNVILVDYRGFDTLGEISVVMAAGIAIMALLRSRKKPAAPPKPRTRKAKGATA